jgi:hypothetical protein
MDLSPTTIRPSSCRAVKVRRPTCRTLGCADNESADLIMATRSENQAGSKCGHSCRRRHRHMTCGSSPASNARVSPLRAHVYLSTRRYPAVTAHSVRISAT